MSPVERCVFAPQRDTLRLQGVYLPLGDFRSIQINGDSGPVAAANGLNGLAWGGEGYGRARYAPAGMSLLLARPVEGNGKSPHEIRSRQHSRHGKPARRMRARVRDFSLIHLSGSGCARGGGDVPLHQTRAFAAAHLGL